MRIRSTSKIVSALGLLSLTVSCGQAGLNENHYTSAEDSLQNEFKPNSSTEAALQNEDDEEILGLVGQDKFMSVANKVSSYYMLFLKRNPDESGLLNYVGKVLSKQMTLGQVSSVLKNSPEATVVRLYQEVLGRVVDANGRQHYTKEITAGRLNESSLRTVLLNSDEYRAKIAPTLKQLVTQTYQQILARSPSSNELAGHVAALEREVGQGGQPSTGIASIKIGLQSSIEAVVVKVMRELVKRAPNARERERYIGEVRSSYQNPETYLKSRIASQPEAQIISAKAQIIALNKKIRQLAQQPSHLPIGYEFTKQAFTALKKSSKYGRPIYRLYNAQHHSHMYSADQKEISVMVQNGWKNEGVEFKEPPQGGVLVHRFYIPQTSKHIFTTNPAEIASIEKKWGGTAIKEGTPFRVVCAGNCSSGSSDRILIYALQNARSYFLTPNGF